MFNPKLIYLLWVLSLLPYNITYAKEWYFSPKLTTSEIYTDNYLLSNQAREAFITEISPGFSLRKNSNRLQIRLNYQLQTLYNHSEDKVDLYNQLQFNSSYQIFPNRFFIDTRATNSQINITNNNIATDNISGSQNRTDLTTYGISPNWTPHFGGYASGNIRLNYDVVNTSADSVISNTTRTEEIVNFTSGRYFTTGTWQIQLHNREENRDVGSNVKYQDINTLVRTRINMEFNWLVTAGYSNNQFESIANSNKNGFHYAIGAQWLPSSKLNLEAAGGNNSHISVNLIPIRNMLWNTTFRHNEIGTNIGNVWQTFFNYKTPQAIVNASYQEDTTSTQNVLLNQQVFNTTNAFGEPIYDPVKNLTAIDLPSLSNEVYVRKRAEISMFYRTGKTFISLKPYNERRTYQIKNSNEDVTGIQASMSIQIDNMSSLYLSPIWQYTKRVESHDSRYDVRMGVSHIIPIKIERTGSMNASLEYRYTNVDGNLIGHSYEENRVTASVSMTF